MGIFSKKNKTPLVEGNGNVNNYEIAGLDTYNFIKGLRLIASDTYNTDYVLDRMLDDAIISSAVDMYLDDTLQVDPQKKEIFWVEVDMSDDKVEKELAKGLTKELNSFLKEDLRMDKEIRKILRRTILYGSCPVRLDFIDKLADDRLQLIDKNKKTFESIAKPVFDVLLEQHSTDDLTGKITDMVNKEETIVNLEQLGEVNLRKKIVKYLNEESHTGTRRLTESKLLNEDILDDTDKVKRLLRGRWCVEVLGTGTNIWELNAKGKTVAYMDVRKPNYFISPKNIANFSNNTGKYHINFEVGAYDETDAVKQYFSLDRGQSFLENSIVAWQVLSALEDILMLTRMTRSTLYRIFSVEVGNKSDTETKQILNSLKNKIKSDETIDVRQKVYNSELRQIPLGDSIFIPTRNGIGNIDIKVVGGDINLKDAIDLDYFKDKLFASLRIPKAFLGFSEDSGGMINTSLTRMDIRYARTIKGIQNIASNGLKDLCLKYLQLTRPNSVLRELPDFKIVFTSVNTEEDSQRCETKQTQMDTLGKILEAFDTLGINVAETKGLRDELIKEWLGSEYLDIIKEAEDKGELSTTGDDTGKSGGTLGGGRPSGLGDFPDLSGGGNFTSDIDEPDENLSTGDNGEDVEEIGAGDEDFEASPTDTLEPPSGLSREIGG